MTSPAPHNGAPPTIPVAQAVPPTGYDEVPGYNGQPPQHGYQGGPGTPPPDAGGPPAVDRKAAIQNDLVQFVAPDPQKMSAAVQDIVPAFKDSFEFLTKVSEPDPTNLTGQWPTQWFAFWEDPIICLWTYCCHCIVAPRTMAAVSGNSCESHCLSMLATSCCFCGACYFAKERTRLRTKYNLAGSKVEDLVLSCCCICCLLCQQARVVSKREPRSLKIPFAS